VKNCGKNFHVLVANKEFIQELVKLISPKHDPPIAVQEKVLNLIQLWAETFAHQPELKGVVEIYQELKNKVSGGVLRYSHRVQLTIGRLFSF
jgi:hypothetical protein